MKIKLKLFSALLAVSMLAGCSGDESSAVVSEETAETTVDNVIETSAETTGDNATETASESSAVPEVKIEDGGSYIRMPDGVKPEMMNASYWIKEGSDKVLMDEAGIKEFNNENLFPIKAKDGTELPLFGEIGDSLDGEILRTFLRDNEAAVPKDPSQYYLNGKSTDSSYWQQLVGLSNIEGVPDEVKVRYGYTVKRMTVRLFPTEDKVYEGPSDKFFDAMIYSECMPYLPVYVLHESTDGEYLYVVFDSYSAWVRKDAVALCESREDWESRQAPKHFLTVTGRELRFGDDPYTPAVSNLVLPMGTRMALADLDEAPQSVTHRATFANYVVKVPTRGEDGYVKDEYVLIPVSDDVTPGYLSLTPANILKQSFKLLGDRYGWAGDLRANDCTGIIREVYNCFGILIPRGAQSKVKGVFKTDMSEMSDKEKLGVFAGLEAGSLIYMPGHAMIYIGTVDNVPYVINANGGFTPPEPGSNDRIYTRSVTVNSLYVRTSSLKSWLSRCNTAVTVKKD